MDRHTLVEAVKEAEGTYRKAQEKADAAEYAIFRARCKLEAYNDEEGLTNDNQTH